MTWSQANDNSFAPETLWYDEEKPHYDYETGDFTLTAEDLLTKCHMTSAIDCPQIGHFTQMVWDDTSRLGCGRTFKHDDEYNRTEEYMVCRYASPGNWVGMHADHVHCPIDGSGVGCPTDS